MLPEIALQSMYPVIMTPSHDGKYSHNCVLSLLNTHDEGFHYRFFDTAIDPDNQHYLSEDLAFCQLWRQHGGEIYLDAYSNLNHQGIKLFTGNFSQSLINDPAKAVQCPPNQPIVLSGVEHLMPHPTQTNE